jgi:hypothetical protein
MTKGPRFTQEHQDKHDVHKLLSPEMRQEIARLSEQMGEFAAHLTNLCNNLQVINDAVFNAKEIAECLLTDDPFGAWEVIKRSQQAFEATGGGGAEDWDPNNFD